ncbi:MAG: nitrous oxide-stimulated promoter family protein [Spirochaetales bacterium]|nr:nitrous oxide-stimulated promoter family protein [Spirochaetales bacterium]
MRVDSHIHSSFSIDGKATGRVEREKRVVRFMIAAFCRARHGRDGTRDAAGLCDDCAELAAYAEARLAACRYGERKPSCGLCPTRCYRSDMRERIRAVMRWSGPRMLYLAPLDFFRHLGERRGGSRDGARFRNPG